MASTLALTACTGSQGDQCQEEDDCNSGLTCCKIGSDLVTRGTCQPSAECDATPRTDAGLPGVDAGPAMDGGLRCDPGLLVPGPDGGLLVVDGGAVVGVCPVGWYCGEGAPCSAGESFCQPVPESCEAVLAPVCACGRKVPGPEGEGPVQTFQNECGAHQAGRRIQSAGTCEAPIDAGTDAGPPDAGADAGTDAGSADAGADAA